MSKPLHLFIKTLSNWNLVFSYGPVVPEPSTGPEMHNNLRLTTGDTGALFAAANGKLSVRPPTGGILDPTDIVDIPDPGMPLPPTIDLFLHLAPLVADAPTFSATTSQIGGITGFAYINIETASLETALAELLDAAILPVGALTRTQIVNLLVQGMLDIAVTSGHAIGNASTQGAAAGQREVGFTIVTNYGPMDPSYTYDLLRDFTDETQQDIDDFIAKAPKSWPVIEASLPTDQAIALTQIQLYPLSVLANLRSSRSLNADQWRQVGNNQKQLIRNRLLKRIGQAPLASTDPPFEFDNLDANNIFQLEAIVELYLNFNDPWRPSPGVVGANVARDPLLADGTPDPDYIKANFLNIAGAAATVAGNVVTLDGNPDLSRVRIGYDFLLLNDDTSTTRTSHFYLITDKNVSTFTVTLEAGDAPVLTGGTSTWEIKLRPHIVLIDSFGSRNDTKGNNATIVSQSSGQVQLDGQPNLARVNPFFDTIYLPSDTFRPTCTYRIVAVDTKNQIVTLDAPPVLQNDASVWHIPAGLSGELPPVSKSILLGSAATGFDHYDGLLFVIYDGQVQGRFRWSSYSAHQLPAGTTGDTSSMRGNRQCDFRSYMSENAFKNYDFKIEDPGANDHVLQARYYFDNVPGGVNNDTNGKTLVRIHDGNTSSSWNGSSGCVVSPNVYQMRDKLIDIYQEEYKATHNNLRDPRVDLLYNRERSASQTLWNNSQGATPTNPFLLASSWNDKIFGTFWLIRPDERQLNTY